MAFGQSTVGLLFSIKADSKPASKELTDFRQTVEKEIGAIENKSKNAFTDLAHGLGLSAEKTAALTNALPVLGTAVAGLAVTVAGTGVALFSLAKSAADAGTEIQNFSTLTGLSAQAISTIKVASDAAGTSLEEFEEVWESFIEVLIEGGKGADDAKEKLKQAGIDPQKGFQDLEGSVKKAFDAVRNAKTTAEASAIAMAVFGESGLNMVKVAREMEGGFAKYQARLEEMGLVMDKEAVQKSKEFDRELKTLTATATGVAYTFAREFMPDITSAMGDISEIFMRNKDTVREWGQSVSNVFKDLFKDIDGLDFAPALEKIAQNAAYAFGKYLRSEFDKQWRDISANPAYNFGNSAGKGTGINKSVYDSLTTPGGLKGTIFDMSTWGDRWRGTPAAQPTGVRDVPIYGDARDGQRFPGKTSTWKPPADDKGAGKSAAKTSGENFDKEFRKFAEEFDFNVSRTFGKAVNKGSKHPSGLAGDLGIKGKSVEEIVSVLAAGIQKGWRALDERFVGALPGVKTKGPNAHFEGGNSKKASMFIENRPDLYGGQEGLDYLKRLDAERLNKKSATDEIESLKEERKKKAKADEKEYQRKKDSFKSESEFYEELDRRADEGAQKMWDASQARLENEKRVTDEINASRLATVQSERELIDFRAEQERKILVNDVDSSTGQKRIDALIVLRESDIAEAKRKKDRDDADAKAALERDLADLEERAKKDVELKKRIDDEKIELEKLYKNRLLMSDEEYQAAKKAIEENFNPNIKREQALVGAGDIFGSFATEMGKYLENIALVRDANGELEFSFSKMFGSIGQMGMVAFASLAQGFGQMVGNWVLYGDKGGQSLRKLAAQILSQVATVATTYSIMSLGAAALASTVWGAALLGGTPSQFLGAAAIFGGIAAGSALAGRAVAGDQFKQQTSSSAISGDSASNFNSSQNSSSSSPRVLDEDRVRRQEEDSRIKRIETALANMRVDVKLHTTATLDRGIISDTVMQDMSNQHPLKDYFRELVGDK